MALRTLVTSRFAQYAALWLGRHTPAGLGYGLFEQGASWMANFKGLEMVRAVRANQWVVRGENLDSRELDRAVHETFREIGHMLFEFYYLHAHPQRAKDIIVFEPSFSPVTARMRVHREGTILVSAHMGNFDLAGEMFSEMSSGVQVLSIADPTGGYQVQNELREQVGVEATPVSQQALGEAVRRLRSGGTIALGIDRPEPGSKYRMEFFGRTASLPTGHVRLALRLNLPVFVIGIHREGDGRYHVYANDPVVMERDEDLDREVTRNGEHVLAVLAEEIRKTPEQWNMTYPVWPEISGLVP